MAFATWWSRVLFRQTWRQLVGIAVVLGLIGGLSLFALAGARRTQSSYPRFLRSTNPSTMVVDVGGLDPSGYETLDAIAYLPQVVQARAYAGFYVAAVVDGQPDFSQNFEAVGSIDGRYFDQDRFTPISGRLPDPTRTDEVAVNERSARLFGYHVGQQIDFATVSAADVEGATSEEAQQSIQPRLLIHSTIVGIGALLEEILQDDTDRSPLVLFTPAYVKEAKGLQTYAWQGLVLRNGDADVAAVKKAITEKQGGGPQIFRVTATDTFHAEQAIRPVSLALAVFGLIVGIGCLVVVGQALGRYVRSRQPEHAIARSLGAGPRQVAAAMALGPAIAIVVGVLLAVLCAVLSSPAMPIGPVRRVEVASGISVDWAVLGIGGVGSVLVLFAVIAVVACREAPQRARHTRSPRRRRVFPTADLPPTMATGLRLSASSTQGSTTTLVHSVMSSAAVAVAALAAAATFGASMQHLVSQPRLFGWNWDVALVDGAGYGNTKPAATNAVLAADDNIEGWSGAFFGAEDINGLNLPLLGMSPSSPVAPPIRDGRMIERAGEIVLGTTTLAELHARIGDTVDSSSGPLHIVGSATFPTLGVVHGDHTSLGVGGIVITQQVPGYDRNMAGTDPESRVQTPADEYGPNVLFVRFRHGVDRRAAVERLTGEVEPLADSNGIVVTPVQRSAEIVNADGISGASTVLGSAIGFSALATLTLGLTAVVRHRRRDLALLEALGFTRRQLTATIAWHATSIVSVGLVIGVPLGVVLGRLTWTIFARQLDVVAEPVVPVIAIVSIVVAAVASANVLAIFAARRARTVPAALILRDQ